MNWFAAPAVASAAFYAIGLIAAVRRLREPQKSSSFLPPLSVLKPVRGRDANFREAIDSHLAQDYPEFEILFGVGRADDPAVTELNAIRAPNVRVIYAPNTSANGKVGVLAALAREARYPTLLVNDGDIVVERDYLRRVAAELDDPAVGMVTCLYRARGESFPARMEALGVATEFAPSVLVARMLGVAGFALGATMAFRAEDLKAIGGFEALSDYLADDYQLGKRIAGLGKRVALAGAVVETGLGAGTWRDVWAHQVRWSRTVRVSRPEGYYGYIATQAAFWCLVAAAGGAWRTAVAAMAVRLLAGLVTGSGVLGDRAVLRRFWLIPARDLFGFAVWLAGLGGSEVEWRGERLKLAADGRIRKV